MVKTYTEIADVNDFLIEGRTKLFIEAVDEAGNILNYSCGILLSPSKPGTLFIVDSYLCNQLDKLQLINGELKVKEGETIEEPALSKEELRIIELEKELASLRQKTGGDGSV